MGEKTSLDTVPSGAKKCENADFLRLAVICFMIEVVGKLLNCNMSKIEPSASNLPKVSLFL